MVDCGVIIGDNVFAGFATICSILNQTTPPDRLFILQNPQDGRCLTAEAHTELTALLTRVKTECSVLFSKETRIVPARALLEKYMHQSNTLWMSDGDHFYPPDFLETCLESLQHHQTYSGGYVTCEISKTGLGTNPYDSMVYSDDYLSGGTYVYPYLLRGLWDKVSLLTQHYGDDRVWRALAKERGFTKSTLRPREILHLTAHSSSKYPKGMPAEARAYCDDILGPKTVSTESI